MSNLADVLDANDAFYRAIREADYMAMETIWARRRHVTCTHPGTEMLNGRDAVLDSWHSILLAQDPPDIWPGEPDAVIAEGAALVLCIERFAGIELMATNTFIYEDGAWCLLDHSAARMSAEQAQ